MPSETYIYIVVIIIIINCYYITRLYGSYESLDAGQTTDALIDMTGGIQEQFDLKKLSSTDRAHFWTYLEKGFELGALMGCYIAVNILNSVSL